MKKVYSDGNINPSTKRSNAIESKSCINQLGQSTSITDAPGGLIGYLSSRKVNSSVSDTTHNSLVRRSNDELTKIQSSRLKYHKLANVGASCDIGSFDIMSDDNEDADFFDKEATSTRPSIFDTPSSVSGGGKSWFQKESTEININKETYSWVSQAMNTVDHAANWIYATSSSTWRASGDERPWYHFDSNHAILPSLSSYVPTNWSLFSSDNKTTAFESSDNGNTAHHLPLAFLPNLASKFEFATKRRNPYSAVIGRDTDYLLSSNTPYYFWRSSGAWNSVYSLTSWISRVTNNSLKLASPRGGQDVTKEDRRILQKAMKRTKSQPSEASVDAVKNLLYLVKNQVDITQSSIKRHPTNSSYSSSNSSLDARIIQNTLEGHRENDAEARDSGPSADYAHHHSLNPQLSFDSYNSQRAKLLQSSPARASAELTPHNLNELHSFRHSSLTPQDYPTEQNNESNRITSADPALNAEMAARLAEGTLRAYRDLVLDEAAELHSALHHWTLRWEKPFIGWLESGPSVWFSEGYSPYEAGRKVSQIQAVLARRCASIGEIQQHIWRATWTKGVAEWGMLGGAIGGEWAAVVGGDGGMDDLASSQTHKFCAMEIFNHSLLVGSNVTNAPGGRILIDQDAQAIWSIDALRVIRDQLYRATAGAKALPHFSNWPRELKHFSSDMDELAYSIESDLPVWADTCNSLSNSTHSAPFSYDSKASIVVTDLSKMADEVECLLQTIEISLYQQRRRRLDQLRPPSRLRRNWYVFALGVPTAMYVGYKLTKEHGGFFLLRQVFSKVADIYQDHVLEPLRSIYQELVKGRLDVTDRKARIDAIESLKRMIRSWLDENFPKMDMSEKNSRAEAMDISLIEQNMEESIKYIYEAPALVRMSLIEMQFIKKELLNALVAMDELMGSNEINMRIAAMTPAVILLLAIRRSFQWLFYAIFRVGRSREDVYATVRQTILDIERLLVMRDNPPPAPDSLQWGSTPRHQTQHSPAAAECTQTLSADDLGMVLLHIHECRQIIWHHRRRFGGGLLRNLIEDLAELAGERGPVSLKQQLQIVERMSRVYLFMKPRSTFITKV